MSYIRSSVGSKSRKKKRFFHLFPSWESQHDQLSIGFNCTQLSLAVFYLELFQHRDRLRSRDFMGFKMIKLTSKALFYHLHQHILPLFTIKWPLFFKMDKNLFFIKKFISIFSGHCSLCSTMSPMCNTFLKSLGLAHWVQPVYFK